MFRASKRAIRVNERFVQLGKSRDFLIILVKEIENVCNMHV